MTRKAFLALFCAIPAAAVVAFRRKRKVQTDYSRPGYFRARFMAGLDPGFGRDKSVVVLWKQDATGTLNCSVEHIAG